ncbi:hypothetical protein Sru01_42170 [Sphaerisporangium rufum]|uniref:Histidine kinase/HSP90-like ATPase domain-containing protein n=1 Tax=Sphaerisporangium rufum TaxID=1381558 RepID=A0A919R8G5_9ACTN|nr:ATP-binding protein [Sphaerisporangium rufum]GII79235.1 hypothetical protein Sru01_42170 [Sphaerisporangium rufum]
MIAMRPRALAFALDGLTGFFRSTPRTGKSDATDDRMRPLTGPAAFGGIPVVSRRFAPCASQVRPARAFVAGLLGAEHPCRDNAILLTSELAANVMRHAIEQEFLVSVAFPGTSVLVAIEDGGSSKIPHLRRPADDETEGRGLLIVDDLASRWGFERRPSSTLVWFELAPSSS